MNIYVETVWWIVSQSFELFESGVKCYTLSAKALQIASVDNPEHWELFTRIEVLHFVFLVSDSQIW